VRYPLVEGATAVLWLGLGAWALAADRLPLLPLLLVLGSAGLALAVIDLDHHRLPDAIVLPLYPVTAAGLVLAGVLEGSWPLGAVALGVLAWLVPIGGIFVVSGGRGMGFGDVKLAPVLGATLGWVAVSAAVVGVLAGFVLGAVVGIALVLGRRAHRRSHLAFGPFLLAGALVGLLAGPALADAYLGWALG
jgi:leader peptidase (prepilin peptidase)/N-methyltransferase